MAVPGAVAILPVAVVGQREMGRCEVTGFDKDVALALSDVGIFFSFVLAAKVLSADEFAIATEAAVSRLQAQLFAPRVVADIEKRLKVIASESFGEV